MVAGVCAGVAESFGFNIQLTRIIFLICLLCAGTGFIAYLILWVLMPKKDIKKNYADRMQERLNNNK